MKSRALQKPIDRRSAFIVCEAGTDIAPLVAILDELDFFSLNREDVTTAKSLIRSTRELMDQADIVLAILEGLSSDNVMFELGIAFGLRRAVAIIGSGGSALRNLEGIFWIRASLSDQSALKFQLEAFISNFRFRVPRPAPKELQTHFGVQSASKIIGQGVTGSALEQDMLHAFQNAVEIASIVQQPRADDYQNYIPDFAVWTTSAVTAVEGPTIIEVKGGQLKTRDYQKSVDRLREYATATSVPSALLLLDSHDTVQPKVESLFPLVITLGITECKSMLSRGNLVDTLRRERNRFAHSAA